MRACTRAMLRRTPSAAAVPVDDGIQRSHARSDWRGRDRPLPRSRDVGPRAGTLPRVPGYPQQARRCAPSLTFRDTGALCPNGRGFNQPPPSENALKFGEIQPIVRRVYLRCHPPGGDPPAFGGSSRPPTPIAEYSPVSGFATVDPNPVPRWARPCWRGRVSGGARSGTPRASSSCRASQIRHLLWQRRPHGFSCGDVVACAGAARQFTAVPSSRPHRRETIIPSLARFSREWRRATGHARRRCRALIGRCLRSRGAR
jgi:hypothetical protein